MDCLLAIRGCLASHYNGSVLHRYFIIIIHSITLRHITKFVTSLYNELPSLLCLFRYLSCPLPASGKTKYYVCLNECLWLSDLPNEIIFVYNHTHSQQRSHCSQKSLVFFSSKSMSFIEWQHQVHWFGL